MSRRTEQLDEQLRSELANLIAKNIPLEEGLITIIFVKCSPDLRYAKIGISVLPETMCGTALRNLKKHNSLFFNSLRKKLNLKFIPKFNWVIDGRERHAVEMEKVFKELADEEDNAKNYEPSAM